MLNYCNFLPQVNEKVALLRGTHKVLYPVYNYIHRISGNNAVIEKETQIGFKTGFGFYKLSTSINRVRLLKLVRMKNWLMFILLSIQNKIKSIRFELNDHMWLFVDVESTDIHKWHLHVYIYIHCFRIFYSYNINAYALAISN